MAKFKPYKILDSQLNSLSILEGQLIFTTDTKKIYIDTSNTERILFTDNGGDYNDMWIGTLEEYNKAIANNEIEDNTLIYITDDSEEDTNVVNADTLSGKKASDFAEAEHTHTQNDIVGSINANTLGGKASEDYAAAFHTHTSSDITDFSYNNLSNKPVVNGQLQTYTTISGNTSSLRNIFISTSEPTSSNGNDGDIWITYTEEDTGTEATV
jgi:hypothetical protein